jgi:3-hydroxyisobutyrate dehydrogenase
MLKVGFIGLGIMGQPMATNIVKAGFPLTVFNRSRGKCGPVAALGAAVANSPREVAAQSDVVITIVSDTPDVEEVLFGEAGVEHVVKPGTTVIDMSTISPRATLQFSRRLLEKGCTMLDAPVSGAERGAREGTLSIMVGGDKDVFEKCMPVFNAMGKTIVYTGPSGNGQKTKLVNQVIGSLNVLAVVEGLRLASAAGLNMEETFRAVSSGAAASRLLTNLGPKILSHDFAPGFSIKLHQKDLRLATEFIAELSGDFPGAQLVFSLFSEALRRGLGDQGNQGLINLWSHDRLAPLTESGQS